MNNIDKLNDLIKKCKCSVTITINDHRNYYETVDSFFRDIPYSEDRNEIEDSVYNKMVEMNTVIEIQFYPRTPIGFYKIYHYDIDDAIDMCLDILVKNE